jgi:hypothetical protein
MREVDNASSPIEPNQIQVSSVAWGNPNGMVEPMARTETGAFSAAIVPRTTAIPADWTSRPSYLAVLERFLSVREARTGVPEYWEPMFGTHPRHVVEALVRYKPRGIIGFSSVLRTGSIRAQQNRRN